MSYEDCFPTCEGMSFVYGLTVGSALRYVGVSENPMRRFRWHLNAKRGTTLPLLGVDRASAGLIILEAADRKTARDREEFWIRTLSSRMELANVTFAQRRCAARRAS